MPHKVAKPQKRAAARQRLEEMIRDQSLWGQRLMGERELALELGVGRQTVRLALAELEAAGVVERRQGAGTFVVDRAELDRRTSSAQIAIITAGEYQEEIGWHYKGEMIRSVLEWGRRRRAECRVLSLDRAGHCERIWDAKYMAGFNAFISVQLDDRTLLGHLIRLRRGPVALLDHTLRDLPVIGVVNASFEGGRTTARHLLALGHRRVAFIDCWNSPATNPDRIAGYHAALFEKGIEHDEDLVVAQSRRSGDMRDADMADFAREAVERFMKLDDPPTAIFAFDDNRALPVLRALEERGLRVGENFCVAGYGDSAFRRGRCDRLTSCRIYPRQMGREALRAVLEKGESREGRTIIVPDRLYVRKSTCPPVKR